MVKPLDDIISDINELHLNLGDYLVERLMKGDEKNAGAAVHYSLQSLYNALSDTKKLTQRRAS